MTRPETKAAWWDMVPMSLTEKNRQRLLQLDRESIEHGLQTGRR